MTRPCGPDERTLPGGELAAYVLGLLLPDEAAVVEAHLDRCVRCRAEWEDLSVMTDTLDSLPAEAVLEGPPDSDLLLQRTLRQVRAERAGARRRRRVLVGIAATALGAALLGGGVVVGQALEPGGAAPAAPTAAPPGSRTAQTVQGPVTAAVTLTPANGWVRLAADVRGVPAGEHCRLVVVAADGTQEIAGGWVVPVAGETGGVKVQGSAGVPADAVRAVLVQNTQGETYAQLTL